MAKPKPKSKKPYEKPAVVYKRKMEVLAKICDSAWINPLTRTCRTAVPTCSKLKD